VTASTGELCKCQIIFKLFDFVEGSGSEKTEIGELLMNDSNLVGCGGGSILERVRWFGVRMEEWMLEIGEFEEVMFGMMW
jgi:hypothetical protein